MFLNSGIEMYNTILKLRDQVSLCEHLHVFRTCTLPGLLTLDGKKKKQPKNTKLFPDLNPPSP